MFDRDWEVYIRCPSCGSSFFVYEDNVQKVEQKVMEWKGFIRKKLVLKETRMVPAIDCKKCGDQLFIKSVPSKILEKAPLVEVRTEETEEEAITRVYGSDES